MEITLYPRLEICLFGFWLASWMTWFYIWLLFPLLCLTSFVFYGVDKWLARKEARRIPEATLHLVDAVGGWPGGWLGQRLFRHKTRKKSFQLLFWASVLFHLFSFYVVYRSFFG